MFRGFNLSVLDNCFKQYEVNGRSGYQEQKNEVGLAIESFKGEDGSLVGARLIEDWFPGIDCEVFISHARNDSELAIGLAGFLEYEFGLTSFIDSSVWGHSNSLLRSLDDKYCYQPGRGTYSYEKRNKSTSHVHMMLSTALAKMLDKCECAIFLNTAESISSERYIDGSTTDSPWLYAEIVMTSLIRKRNPRAHRELAKSIARADEDLQINYGVDLSHLSPLSLDELKKWRDRAKAAGAKNGAALDILYGIT